MTKYLKHIVRRFLSIVVNQDIDKSSQFFAVSVALMILNKERSDFHASWKTQVILY